MVKPSDHRVSADYSSLVAQRLPHTWPSNGQTLDVVSEPGACIPARRSGIRKRKSRTPGAHSRRASIAYAEVNRDVSLEFKTLALQVDESLSRERPLPGFFGGLALLLAMVGLYATLP
jgi:hypothetical protein